MKIETFDDLKSHVLEFVKKAKESFSEPEQKFMDYKLQTGEIISVSGEALAENAQVMIIDTDGQKLPLPTGSYVLEDGTMISVTDGVISKVETGEAKEEVPAEEMNQGDAQVSEVDKAREAKRVIESIVKESVYSKDEMDAKFSAIETLAKESNEKLIAENEALKVELTKQVELSKQMIELLEKFSQLPSEKSSVVKKDGFKKPTAPATDLEKLMAEAAAFSKEIFKD
jgi:hypothetical protein